MRIFNMAVLALVAASPAMCLAQHPASGGQGLPFASQISKVASAKQFLQKATAGRRIERLNEMKRVGVQINSENIETVAEVARSGQSEEERIVAIDLLSGMYQFGTISANNEAIKSKLRPLAQDPDRDVARTAIFSYASTGYSSDVEVLLDFNYNRSYLNKDDLYGELSHLLTFADPVDQETVIGRLKAGSNKYSMQILASYIKDSNRRARLSKPAKSQSLAMLEKFPAQLNPNFVEINTVESLYYADWLHAVALLRSETRNVSYENEILSVIGKNLVNPKVPISFFLSEQGEEFARTTSQEKIKPVFEQILQYKKALPSWAGPNVRQVVQDVLGLQR